MKSTMLFAMLCALAGCSAEASDAPSESESEEAALSRSATFECTARGSGDADLLLTVSATGKSVGVVLGLENQVKDRGRLDTGFTPLGTDLGYVRYVGFPALRDGDHVTFLVERELLLGRAGHVKMQQQGPTLIQTDYRCVRP